MYKKYFEQLKEECLIRNRSSRTEEVLSPHEVETLIDTASHIRNKAVIALLYSSGLRVGELVKLRAEDIYMSRMQVYVPQSKNHRDRWTILSNRALELLKEYWRSYPVKRDYLFVSLDEPHEPLKVSGVEIMLRAVGINAGLYPHLKQNGNGNQKSIRSSASLCHSSWRRSGFHQLLERQR